MPCENSSFLQKICILGRKHLKNILNNKLISLIVETDSIYRFVYFQTKIEIGKFEINIDDR